MPDQPDDAPKRPQRGVLPPFFAPRDTGRAGGSSTPPSGSWRRVSRLFTPPEGTRQRRTPAAQQAPYTPTTRAAESGVPLMPAASEPEEALGQAELAEAGTPEAEIVPQDTVEVRAAEEAALELGERTASEDGAGGPEEEVPLDTTLAAGAELHSPYTAAPDSLEDSRDSIADLAFGDGAEDFMVESLEPKPITLHPSGSERMDVVVDSIDEILSTSSPETPAEHYVSDVTYDEMYSATSYEEANDAHSGPTHEELESVERYLAEEPEQTSVDAPGEAPALAEEHDAIVAHDQEAIDAVGQEPGALFGEEQGAALGQEPGAMLGQESGVAFEQEASVAFDQASVAPEAESSDLREAEPEIAVRDHEPFAASDAADVPDAELDPWAGAELPEPAFGSFGWPTMDEGASPQAVDGVDEMSAALAWSEDGGATGSGGDHGPAGRDDAGDAGDALSSAALAGELRDSTSAWTRDGESPVDERADVEARAHFYAAPDPIDPRDEIAAAAEVDAYGAALPEGASYGDEAAEAVAGDAGDAGDLGGAAIADALARVAARIRSGEIELASEAAGASDESALAAALAALLRGPRR